MQKFWNLIDKARAGSSASVDPESMAFVLKGQSNEVVAEFGHMFYDKLCELNRWPERR